MKQGILIVFFVILLITAGFFEQAFIINSFSVLEEKTLILQTAILAEQTDISTPLTLEKFKDIKSFWIPREKTLCLFINHQHIEEVNIQIATIEIALSFNDKQKVLTSLELILNFINGYSDFAIMSWESIF